LARQVLNIAHRGAAALWPENTLAAFKASLMAGADGLEIDVQLTADDWAVVHHDFSLKPDFTRTQDGGWAPSTPLAALTRAELSAYSVGVARAGSSYQATHPGLKPVASAIPTLDETLDLFARYAGPKSLLMVELKHPTRPQTEPVDPETLVRRVLAGVRTSSVGDRTVFVGFHWGVMRALKAQWPTARAWFTTYPQSWFQAGATPMRPAPADELAEMQRLYAEGAPWMDGFWPEVFGGSTPRALKAAGADGWLVHGPDAEDADIRLAQALGLAVGVWGVDDEAGLTRFIDLEVDAICTDRPDRLARLLDRPWSPVD
jgi:glycerophosphoryl diester phosphodiesterase